MAERVGLVPDEPAPLIRQPDWSVYAEDTDAVLAGVGPACLAAGWILGPRVVNT